MPYDPGLAERLLDEAGYPKKSDGIRFSFSAPSSDEYTKVAELTAYYWEKVGVKCDWKIVAHMAFYSDYYTHPEGLRDYPMGIFRGGVGPDPDAAGQIYSVTTAKGGLNFGYYYNKTVSDALDRAAAIFDKEERKKNYSIAQKGITSDVACIFFYNTWFVEIWKNEFKGVGESQPPYPAGLWTEVWWTKGTLPQAITTTTATTSTSAPPAPQTASDPLVYGVLAICVIAIVLILYSRAQRKRAQK